MRVDRLFFGHASTDAAILRAKDVPSVPVVVSVLSAANCTCGRDVADV
jgi:hypothetical protein